jgi:choline dehydrogenase-like flavoprotein
MPVELMRDSYDVVVIGSGYGGGVAASRMARGKQSVCVLERGKERWPGEFPEKTVDAFKELHISGDFAPGDRRSIPGKFVDEGNPNGLYHFVVGEGQNVFLGNGLGGTSLLNANVFLETHPDVLKMDIWPEELRGRHAWEKCESRVIACRLLSMALVNVFKTTDVQVMYSSQFHTLSHPQSSLKPTC